MKLSRPQQWKRKFQKFLRKVRILQGVGGPGDSPDSENGPDAQVRAPLKPKPHRGIAAIALPEPEDLVSFNDAISK